MLFKALKRRGMSPSPAVYTHDREDTRDEVGAIEARLTDKRSMPTDVILDHRSDPIEFPVRQVVVLHNHMADNVEDQLPSDGKGISFGMGDNSQRSDEGWRKLKGARLQDFLKNAIRRGHDIEISMGATVGEPEVFLISPARVKDDDEGKQLVEGYDHHRTRGSTWRVEDIDQVRLLE